MPRYTTDTVEIPVELAKALLKFTSSTEDRYFGFGIDDGCLCATNGHRGVRIHPCDPGPIQPMNLNGHLIGSVPDIKRKIQYAQINRSKYISIESAGSPEFFPPLSKVWPLELKITLNRPIGLNPDYLSDMSELAACSRGLTLAQWRKQPTPVTLVHATSPIEPIVFEILSNTGQIYADIIIMPIRT